MRKISLNEQIDEVVRELAKRATVYPRAVQIGKMRQSIADYQVERMTAVLNTLRWFRDNEEKIRAVLGKQPNHEDQESKSVGDLPP
jgi:hypothetical protein